MLTWLQLDAIANEICRVSRQLHLEARRLEREQRPVSVFRRTEALPSVLVLSDGLEATLWDQLDVRRAASPGHEDGEAKPQRVGVEIEYQAIAEIRRRASDHGRVVAFHFTTTWPRLNPHVASPEARVAAQRALRKIDALLRKVWTAWPSWDAQARATITAKALSILEARNKLLAALWPHQLRASLNVKAAQWRWRSGQTELASHGLGPIVLSPATTSDEVCLKMTLLSARQGALDAGELDPILHAVERYLRIDRESARDVFGRAATGYVGDLSPVSFRTYLRAIFLSAWRREKATTRSSVGGRNHESDREALPRNGRWRVPGASGREARHDTREYIRLPEDEPKPHPWAAGQPALLSRLAVDYWIEARVARSWWRSGKITALGCRRREERTVTGRHIEGTIEVPALERRAWEDLCTNYFDKRARARLAQTGTSAEKRRLYRAASRHGGSRERAAVVVRQRAREAGLRDRYDGGT